MAAILSRPQCVKHQASNCTNADLLSDEPLGSNFNEILIQIQNSSEISIKNAIFFSKQNALENVSAK